MVDGSKRELLPLTPVLMHWFCWYTTNITYFTHLAQPKPLLGFLTLSQVGLFLEHTRMSIDLLYDALDPHRLGVKVHLLAVLCENLS